MGLQCCWEQISAKSKLLINSINTIVKQPFHVLTTTLLSLLLPLSFLLLARLACADYLLSLSLGLLIPNPDPITSSNIFSLFLYITPFLLYILVSVVSLAAFIHCLTGKITIITEFPSPVFRPRLYTAWIFLCTLQVCVGLGIEGSIAAGIGGSTFSGIDERICLLSRTIFFLGLHETMLHWGRVVVKPVVDDTVFGAAREERWVERVAMAASFGCLWWWRLREEVESLVVVAKAKRELSMGIGVADFVGWWLYYLTVTIGLVKIVKGIMWLSMVLLCRRSRGGNYGNNYRDHDHQDNKV